MLRVKILIDFGEIFVDELTGDSGGFLNPAITFSFCLYRGLPWRRFPVYFLAQFLGGFVAAGVIYANYVNAINNYEGHNVRTVPPSKTATGKTPMMFQQLPKYGLADVSGRWSVLYIPTGFLNKDKSILLGIHYRDDSHVCYLCPQRRIESRSDGQDRSRSILSPCLVLLDIWSRCMFWI